MILKKRQKNTTLQRLAALQLTKIRNLLNIACLAQ